MEYTVVSFPDVKKFEFVVADLIKKGWKLSGSASITFDNKNQIHYVQALIKGAE